VRSKPLSCLFFWVDITADQAQKLGLASKEPWDDIDEIHGYHFDLPDRYGLSEIDMEPWQGNATEETNGQTLLGNCGTMGAAFQNDLVISYSEFARAI